MNASILLARPGQRAAARPSEDQRRFNFALAVSIGLHGLLVGGGLLLAEHQPAPPEHQRLQIDLVGLLAERQVDVASGGAAPAAAPAPTPAPAEAPRLASDSPVRIAPPPPDPAPPAATSAPAAAPSATPGGSGNGAPGDSRVDNSAAPTHVAPQDAANSDDARYSLLVQRAIRAQLGKTTVEDGDDETYVVGLRVTVLETGELLPGSAVVAHGSGSRELDARALRALLAAAPFPPSARRRSLGFNVTFQNN